MDVLTQVGDVLPALILQDVDGNAVALDDLLDRPLAVSLVRYYGCMPCRDFLAQIDQARVSLDAVGVDVVGVGGAADYQARHLMDHGMSDTLGVSTIAVHAYR